MDAPKPRQRRKALLIVPVVAVLAVVAFLYLVSSTASPANVASTARAEPVAPAADETEAAPLPSAGEATPGDQPPAPTAEMVAPVETATEPLAIVNGAALAPREFDEAIAIDAVMATLAGQAPTSPALLLEQLINTRLVLQAAGSNLPAIDTAAYLAAMLQAYGRDLSALDQALAAASIERERFDLYFSQVAIADALVRAQQAATGQSAGDYIRTLQQQAQISFGGEASAILSVAAADSAPASEAAPDIQAPITAPLAAEETAAGVPAVDEPRGTEIGQLAPDFTLPTLTEVDESINLRNLLYAPSVLIFWTTWCPYCLRQTPVLVDAYGRWSERGIQFVGINVQEERSAVEPYVAEHGIAYPTLLDVAGDTARAYAIQGYPTTYFLDADNRIVARHVGALTEEQLTEYLQNLQPPAEGS
ncbi:MAG: TlpA family protein disulfide reductase [Caldilineaceae bacterium]|nr:TlpA family protein disulfide reductase [Caldilineaceae bacterium]